MGKPVDFAFLHGGGQGGWVWDEAVAALILQAGEGAARTIQLEVPGCGAKRDRDTNMIGVRDIAAELIGDIERAGLSDVVLVGHSQAGQILPIIAELRPDLIRRLVFVSCVIQQAGQGLMQLMGTGRQGTHPEEVGWPFDPAKESFADHAHTMFMNDMTPEEVAIFSAKLGKDAWPPDAYVFTDWRLDHLASVPSTYVICTQDQSLTPAWQQRFADRVRADRVLHVDAGHQVMNTRPHALAEIVRLEALISPASD